MKLSRIEDVEHECSRSGQFRRFGPEGDDRMRTTQSRRLAGSLGALVLLLTVGCATVSPDVERARGAYNEAASDPELASRAAVELYEAQKSLAQAENAWNLLRDESEAQHRSYLTERKIEIARTAAERKLAEAEIARLTEVRRDFLMDARTREADRARTEAQRRAEEAQARAREAREAQLSAEEALREAEAAREKARKLEAELAEVGARATDRGYVLTLGDVLFDLDKADLKPGALRNLYRLVTFMNLYPDRGVLIEGHTDSLGEDSYNVDLSERRAISMQSFLFENGIARDRVNSKGYGEAFPVASNETQSGRQQNRRVEVLILNPGESPESLSAAPH